jgi:hypothetical protein
VHACLAVQLQQSLDQMTSCPGVFHKFDTIQRLESRLSSLHQLHMLTTPSPSLQMGEGFKKCRKYFDMLDINGDRCAWGGQKSTLQHHQDLHMRRTRSTQVFVSKRSICRSVACCKQCRIS